MVARSISNVAVAGRGDEHGQFVEVEPTLPVCRPDSANSARSARPVLTCRRGPR